LYLQRYIDRVRGSYMFYALNSMGTDNLAHVVLQGFHTATMFIRFNHFPSYLQRYIYRVRGSYMFYALNSMGTDNLAHVVLQGFHTATMFIRFNHFPSYLQRYMAGSRIHMPMIYASRIYPRRKLDGKIIAAYVNRRFYPIITSHNL
jgi:uncharacterized protein Usg